jgi:hypothetical protein
VDRLGRGGGPKRGGGGGSSWGYDPVSFLATAPHDDGEVYWQTDTWDLELLHFYAPLAIGLVVLTSSSPSRGRSCFGED